MSKSKAKEIDWIRLPTPIGVKVLDVFGLIAGLTILSAFLWVGLLWIVSQFKEQGWIDGNVSRVASLTLTALYFLILPGYWYYLYVRKGTKLLFAAAPTCDIANHPKLGQALSFRILQRFRKPARVQDIKVDLDLYFEIVNDEVPDFHYSPELHKLSLDGLSVQSLQLNAGQSLEAEGALQLPTKQEWNTHIRKIAELAEAKTEAVEARLMIHLQIDLDNGLHFQQDFWLSKDQALADSETLTVAD